MITGRSRRMPASSSASLERLAPLVRLLDEVEQHDDVAHDDADEARHAEERHEAERRAHDPEPEQRADDAERTAANTSSGLTAFLNWITSARKISADRDRHHDEQLAEAFLLLLVLAAELEPVAGRQDPADRVDAGVAARQHLRRQHARAPRSGHGDRAELVAPRAPWPAASGRERRDLPQRHLLPRPATNRCTGPAGRRAARAPPSGAGDDRDCRSPSRSVPTW